MGIPYFSDILIFYFNRKEKTLKNEFYKRKKQSREKMNVLKKHVIKKRNTEKVNKNVSIKHKQTNEKSRHKNLKSENPKTKSKQSSLKLNNDSKSKSKNPIQIKLIPIDLNLRKCNRFTNLRVKTTNQMSEVEQIDNDNTLSNDVQNKKKEFTFLPKSNKLNRKQIQQRIHLIKRKFKIPFNSRKRVEKDEF
jgi:hypothetical protein